MARDRAHTLHKAKTGGIRKNKLWNENGTEDMGPTLTFRWLARTKK